MLTANLCDVGLPKAITEGLAVSLDSILLLLCQSIILDALSFKCVLFSFTTLLVLVFDSSVLNFDPSDDLCDLCFQESLVCHLSSISLPRGRRFPNPVGGCCPFWRWGPAEVLVRPFPV